MKTAKSRLPTIRVRACSSSRSPRHSSTVSTPSTLRRSKSSLNLKKTPQSVQARSASAERGRPKKKDARPIQDKKWQANMLEKTQNYFQHCPEAVQHLNKGLSIRPITLNKFVQLTNIILKNIDPNFEELTLANYTDMLPMQLNSLMYPGNISASMLKTANTMHSWPYILAILSWLVELHELMKGVNVEGIIFALPPDASIDLQIKKYEIITKLEFFKQWNNGTEIENQEKIFENDYQKIFNYSEDTEKDLEEKLDNLNKAIQTREEQLTKNKLIQQENKNKVTALEKQEEELKEKIQNQEETKNDIEIKKSDFKLETYRIKNKIRDVKNSIGKIKESIKNQEMSVDQVSHEYQIIDELNAQKKLLEEKKIHQLLLRDEKDIELSKIKQKIEQDVNNYNIELMRPALTYPELNKISLRQDRLIQPDMIEFVKEKFINREELVNNLDKNIIEMKNLISNTQENIIIKQKIIKEANNKEKHEKLKLKELKDKYESVVENYEKVEAKKQKLIKDLEQKILEQKQDIPNLNQLLEQLETYNKKYQTLTQTFLTKQQEMLEFFRKLHDQLITEEEQYDKLAASMQDILNKLFQQYSEPPKSLVNLLIKEN